MHIDALYSSLRVLLVEDSLPNQKLMTHLLRSQGCEDVAVAANGEEGVQMFVEQTFDVVFMDVQMPVMDGLTATRIIRHHETCTGRRALIIAVTAGFDRETCLQAGMDDHVPKPIRPDVLRSFLDLVTGIESR